MFGRVLCRKSALRDSRIYVVLLEVRKKQQAVYHDPVRQLAMLKPLSNCKISVLQHTDTLIMAYNLQVIQFCTRIVNYLGI